MAVCRCVQPNRTNEIDGIAIPVSASAITGIPVLKQPAQLSDYLGHGDQPDIRYAHVAPRAAQVGSLEARSSPDGRKDRRSNPVQPTVCHV
jgi:hypothetical protein